MNYKRIHDNIINNAKSLNRSKKNGTYEEHHIVMRAVGGTDDPDNLVLLTPKEHFIVHYLLWKMHPNIREYRDPIFMFKHKGASNSRLYEAARLSHIKMMKENNPSLHLSDESKSTKSKKLKSYVKTEEHRKKISISNKGNKRRQGAILEDVSKKKISQSVKRWHEEVGVSEETREKLRLASLGRKHNDNSIQKCIESAKKRQKYTCPCCGKVFDGGNLKNHMKSKGFTENDIASVRLMKPEGWQAPDHTGNHGNLPK
jgi:rubrerythrin